MKKQLLVLAIFVLAIFANVTMSYAQCDDALKPLAGKKYTYSVEVNPKGGTFDWFVTTDLKLATATAIPSGTGVAAAGDIIVAGTGYNTPASTTASIDITWTAKAVAEAAAPTLKKYYLVVKYTTTCTNNIKPWRIKPINLFQIAVENINSAGAAYLPICRVGFVDAIIGADDKVTYDFGENALYLKVTANNFTGNWTPKIDIAALKGSIAAPQTIKSIEFSRDLSFSSDSTIDLTSGIASKAVSDHLGDNITTGTDEFVYIKIVVKDDSYEGVADQTLALNFSATDIAGNKDVDVVTGTPCVITAGVNNVSQVLNARPSITNPNPTPFLTAN